MGSKAGYSGRPLEKKLGFKPGYTIALLNTPPNYFELFHNLEEDLVFSKDPNQKKDFIHVFAHTTAQLEKQIPKMRNQMKENGMLWISWPKKASGVPTNLNGNVVRGIGLRNGLVDIKVCAIDETWSGLKFVIPIKNRKVK